HLADFFLRTKGMTRVVSASEVSEGIRTGKSKYRVVDVRPPDEYEKGHVPGAMNIPLDVLFRPTSLEELPAAGDPILLVCQSTSTRSVPRETASRTASTGPVRKVHIRGLARCSRA